MTDPNTPDPTEPRPNRWTAALDSEWLTRWAEIALSAGRVELGYQLSRLAVQAHRYERSGAGQHRSSNEGGPAPAADEAAETEPEPAPAAIATGIATAPQQTVAPNGRCVAVVTLPGALSQRCHNVAFLDPHQRAWTHIDCAIDADHVPVVLALDTYTDVIPGRLVS